ncbi:MAG: nucleoside hydrolase [Lactobacillus sp.]|jgi:inosine-uridine nucleoside N-ribohydrolase|nr:nucleoside hydrolase [Lactobacillus sp.]
MKKVIYDCDNTFGIANRDVDDGLTLLYLLGQSQLDLLGVTLTHGNGTLTAVQRATAEFQAQLGLDFATYLGTQTPTTNPAAEFLVQQVNTYPGEVTIIGTGALTNLAAAQTLDPEFFKKVAQVILMGGTIEPLTVNHHAVAELNFASDPKAARATILAQAPLAIMNGHMTAEAFFAAKQKDQLLAQLQPLITPAAQAFLDQTLGRWIQWNQRVFRFNGFCNWDMTTAIYLTHPELFSQEQVFLHHDQPLLNVGEMVFDDVSAYPVTMPEHLLDLKTFNNLMITGIAAGFAKPGQEVQHHGEN